MSENPSLPNSNGEATPPVESSPSSPQDPERLEGLFSLMSDLQITLSDSPNSPPSQNLPPQRKRKTPPPPPSLMKRQRQQATENGQRGAGYRQPTRIPHRDRPPISERQEELDIGQKEELEEWSPLQENGERENLPPLPPALASPSISPPPTPDEEVEETIATRIETETIRDFIDIQAETPDPKPSPPKKSRSLSAWLSEKTGEDTEETVERLRLLLLDLLIDEEESAAQDKEAENLSLNEATQRQLARLDRKLHDPEILSKLIFPIFGSLLQNKIDRSPEEVVAAFAPLIDLIIGERSREDKAAMSRALAGIIPGALSKQIGDAPDEVVQAIAPAIGRSIKEQIRLDKESMVDALYPVIGNSVSKYMGEAIETINKQIESAFSIQGIYRKLRARIKGVSEGELLLGQSIPFEIQAAFLIHKESGLVIAEAQKPDSESLESDMMAGMLTAIRSFASECVPQAGNTSELTEVDYESFQIVMEVAGYCYIATVTQGEPPTGFYTKLRNTLSAIILNYSYGELLEKFNGDPETIPPAVQELLVSLINNPIEIEPKTKPKPLGVLAIALLLLGLIGIPWGWSTYRHRIASGLERQIMATVQANEELAFYRVQAEARRKTVTLTGQVPSDRLRQQAGNIAASLAPQWDLQNEIATVGLPRDPERLRLELDRQSWFFNQLPGVKITTRYDEAKGLAIVEGGISQNEQGEKIVETFEKIPGVNSVLLTLSEAPVPSQERICFDRGGLEIARRDIDEKLLPLADYLKDNLDIKLRIIGHTDNRGEADLTEDLAPRRAVVVRSILRDAGVVIERLETTTGVNNQFPPGVTANDPLWVSRCVRFEEIKTGSAN
ncbi:MAG: OmpA family protein [Cyanobacteria bacterium P01_E01_bin.42]